MKSIVNWKNLPFLRIILPMIVGILLAIYQNINHHYWTYSLFATTLLLSGLLFWSKSSPSLRKELFFGVTFYLTIFLLGVNLVIFKTAKNSPDHYQKYTNSTQTYIIEINDLPKEKPNSVQIIAEVVSCVDSSNKVVKSSGDVLLYFEKTAFSNQLIQGDKLIVKTNLQDISAPINPGQFNYKQYLSFNQIYQQGFVKSGEFKKIEAGNWSIKKIAGQFRDKMLKLLEENGLKDNELAVASALILGYKEDLGEELKHSYSSAGATHVLAVSGLHVGIIFLVLNFLLNIIDKKDRFKISKAIFLILSLWAYATITGLSPSVVRAATMFSFVTFGKSFGKSSSIYNTLCASAFVLLVYNPYLIMEVGFQLSYLAVLGIVYFQSIIYKWIYVKNKFLKYIWMITSVSIAAQLTTFPLGLLYFHQFPTYFFASNLFVIPGAMLIIGLGILLFITSWAPIISSGIGWVLTKFIWLMNSFIISIDSLPFSLIEGISISILECWIIYFTIVLCIISYESRRMKYLIFGMIGIILFIGIDLVEDYRNSKNNQIVIYQIKGETNLNFIDSQQNVFIAFPSLYKNRSTMLFNVHHHWFDLDLPTPQIYSPAENFESQNIIGINKCYKFKSKTIYLIDGPLVSNSSLTIDILYISSPIVFDAEELINSFQPKYVVLDGKCHWKTINSFSAIKLDGIKIHLLKTEGAFILDF